MPPLPAGGAGAATDMGNVSHVVPRIRPTLGLGCTNAVNHQPESASDSSGPTVGRRP
ncbi:hypothetical protein AB0M68_37780 [Streptomyces sp. NPDC051453]|uniref:hypothetical protein n=1 Tax=Streptomyces sp. NPDC051453 TaxID=3154941 RepID=UPI0034423703